MSADVALSTVLLGAIIGAFASFFNVLFAKGVLTEADIWSFILGGAFGGMQVCAFLPAGQFGRMEIALVALAGYFSADFAAFIVSGGARGAGS